MLGITDRVRKAIRLVGESFEVASVAHRGVFSIATSEVAAKYADQAAVDSSNRPLWLIIVPDNDTTSVVDTIDYAGESLAILNIVQRRHRGAVLFRIILAH